MRKHSYNPITRRNKLKVKLIDDFEGDGVEAKKANSSNESTLRKAINKAINKTKKKPIKTSCLIPRNSEC